MGRRHELTDAQWEILSPLMPMHERQGRPFRDHRQVVNGMFWILRTGAPWRDLPGRFGPWQTVYERFSRWRADGTCHRILEALQVCLDERGEIDWDLWCIDGSSVRAHRFCCWSEKRGVAREPPDHALGRSRGGWGTKLHLVTDGQGLPLAIDVSAGQAHESRFLERVLDAIRIPRSVGRPRQRPRRLAADKGYSFRRIRVWLRARKIRAIIPERSDQRRKRRGRAPSFDGGAYRQRNVVERCVGWLKECRRVATRYEKLAVSYLAMLKLAMIGRYLHRV